MSHTNSTNYRLRIINPAFAQGWEDVNATNEAADGIINTPEKYLLNKSELFEAEGGLAGLAVQCTAMLVGAGAVFASQGRISAAWKTGSLRWMEWMWLGSGSAAGYLLGQ
jgi:hypothetical protein